jgi:Na+/H+ antiporter NhaC
MRISSLFLSLFFFLILSSLPGLAQEPDSLPGGEATLVGEVDIAPLVGAYNDETVLVTPPKILIGGKPAEYQLEILTTDKAVGNVEIIINDTATRNVQLIDQKGSFTYTLSQDSESGKYPKSFNVSVEGFEKQVNVRPVPLWVSILPPLLAILLALIFREVVVSIFLGIFLGAATLAYFHMDSFWGIGQGFLDVISHYLIGALTPAGEGGAPDTGHASIIVFTLLIGGLVAIVSRNGGMQGIVNIIARTARSARSGQFATWLLGIAIFFDDYANSLVVGNTMRSITDRLRISREKLAYIVDSTAAPVAALAFITTWIGAELGYIGEATSQIGSFPEGLNPYGIFLNSLAYSFYPILALIFILIIIFTGRDFGPMLGAERRARLSGQVSRDLNPAEEGQAGGEDLSPLPGIIPKAFNAVIPILVLIAGVIIGLLYTGWSDEIWASEEMGFFRKLSAIVGESDSYQALLWASLSAVIVAILMTLLQGLMGLRTSIDTMVTGFKAMLPALIILVLAWGLAKLTEDMGTAVYLANQIGENPSVDLVKFMPAITFVLAAAVAFSTGSSWGTMAILYPIMLPLIWQLGMDAGIEQAVLLPIFYNAVSAVLAGSVFGDHCSPISDTTILSSLATDCNHVDHVRTQLPYALVVGVVGILLGTVPAAYGWPGWITFPLSILVLLGLVLVLGKKVPEPKMLTEKSSA